MTTNDVKENLKAFFKDPEFLKKLDSYQFEEAFIQTIHRGGEPLLTQLKKMLISINALTEEKASEIIAGCYAKELAEWEAINRSYCDALKQAYEKK